ncbi:hypothetical protein [Lysobacter claricitrinus]|uniref:hypothetical protein n=1 Tax=Lysobacter claricitrinus TaxID=3367728 RepID=UPI0038B3B807
MNVLSTLVHAFHVSPQIDDAATAERRARYAEALENARREPLPQSPDPEAEAFEAQCRRVRESRYTETSADLFHVC